MGTQLIAPTYSNFSKLLTQDVTHYTDSDSAVLTIPAFKVQNGAIIQAKVRVTTTTAAGVTDASASGTFKILCDSANPPVTERASTVLGQSWWAGNTRSFQSGDFLSVYLTGLNWNINNYVKVTAVGAATNGTTHVYIDDVYVFAEN